MKYNDLINDLLETLDKNEDIIKIKSLKKKLNLDEKLKNDLENYRLVKTVSSKQKLYENKDYLEYLKCETNINFLIQDIKSKFNIFYNRKCQDEGN